MRERLNAKGGWKFWQYSISHSSLLLRRPRSNEVPSQIDVLFSAVVYVQCPIYFDDLRIEELEGEEAEVVRAGLEMRRNKHGTVFRLSGLGFSGLIVAGSLVSDESTRHHYDESPLWPFGNWWNEPLSFPKDDGAGPDEG